jgi:hypothetical protein
MLELTSKKERLNQSDYFFHKAGFYLKSNTSLFVESDLNQAIEIVRRTNKFVFCVDENVMISPGLLNKYKNKKYLLSKLRFKLARVSFFVKFMNH